MDVRQQYPSVHWIWEGGISYVYEVDPRIVVKVPTSGEYEREQFQNELKIYELFSQCPPCPYIVECYFYTNNGIFLEYMRDGSLSSRIQQNCIKKDQTRVVTKVEKLEPLPLRKKWMNDLAQAVAFLESLGLAHGDLRPENVLLDRDCLKLSDFDCTAKIGTYFEACMGPYGRLLNGNENQGSRGSAGNLGPRTEQFALGSIYYFINYGFEVYGDRCLTEDPKEHGPETVRLLQDMKFPDLDGDPIIDNIIDKCWHNKYATVAELAAHTKTLVADRTDSKGATVETAPWTMVIGRTFRGLWSWCRLGDWGALVQQSASDKAINAEVPNGGEPNADSCDNGDQNHTVEDSSKRAFCQDLEKRGLLQLVSSGKPEELGFSLGWYSIDES